MLRLPDSMPIPEKKKRVDRIIDALDLKKCLKTSKFANACRVYLKF